MVVVAAVIRIEIISLIFPVIRGITPARDSRSQHLTFLVVAALFFFSSFFFFSSRSAIGTDFVRAETELPAETVTVVRR